MAHTWFGPLLGETTVNSLVLVLRRIPICVSICIHAHKQCHLKFKFHEIRLFFFHVTYPGDHSLPVSRPLTSFFFIFTSLFYSTVYHGNIYTSLCVGFPAFFKTTFFFLMDILGCFQFSPINLGWNKYPCVWRGELP